MKTRQGKWGAMEILWICFFVLCLLLAVLITVKSGFSEALVMYICSGVSFLMFYWRRSLRKSEEKKGLR
ncbi:MAG: hypothetical protein IIU11_02010 [Bacteroidales bacterium]|jgi:hypothetical protein|nr:hypothetical protein [Bacteroidales bacterium]MBR6277425.1 hypothetical protein [Bacteroidales bacterium]